MASRSHPTKQGRQVRTLREKAGLSVVELARTIGITDGAMHNFEAGRRPLPKGLGARIALVLSVDPGELFT